MTEKTTGYKRRRAIMVRRIKINDLNTVSCRYNYVILSVRYYIVLRVDGGTAEVTRKVDN